MEHQPKVFYYPFELHIHPNLSRKLHLDRILFRFSLHLTVLVKVEMAIKVLNYQYTPALRNTSSEIFKETAKNFTAEVSTVFQLAERKRDLNYHHVDARNSCNLHFQVASSKQNYF